MTRPRFASDKLSEALAIQRLLGVYTAGFHNDLLIGRALASHSAKVGPLEDKWLIVQGAYALVTLSAGWARRLEELGHPLPLDSSPGAPVTEFANTICKLGPVDAILAAGSYMSQWRDILATVDLSVDALHYHDMRLVSAAGAGLAETIAIFGAAHPEARTDRPPISTGLLDLGDRARSLTGTPRLDVSIPATRAYPPQARLITESSPIPSSASNRERYAASLHDQYQIEFIAIDIPLVNIVDQIDLPIDFYADMVRHAHDEMRHCWLLDRCLAGYSIALGDFPFVVPDRYELMVEQDILYRLVILSRTGESEAIDLLTQIVPQLEAAGETESVRMWEYVLRDEVRHTSFANKWLRYLVGDSDEAVADATGVAIEKYNSAIRAGRLSKPLRPADFISRPSDVPVDQMLYSLAGFSQSEILTMTNARQGRTV